MEKDTRIMLDLSRQRIEAIEQRCRKMRSEAIADGVMALVSARLFKDQRIQLKPAEEPQGGECTA